jgi:hypothetical protein
MSLTGEFVSIEDIDALLERLRAQVPELRLHPRTMALAQDLDQAAQVIERLITAMQASAQRHAQFREYMLRAIDGTLITLRGEH